MKIYRNNFTAARQILSRGMNRKHLAETVSRRDADAEPQGWARFNQHGARLGKVLSIHVSHICGITVKFFLCFPVY
jgi:hypothetical protein